jgi:hypothetical protein
MFFLGNVGETMGVDEDGKQIKGLEWMAGRFVSLPDQYRYLLSKEAWEKWFSESLEMKERRKRAVGRHHHTMAVKDLMCAHHCARESGADWCIRLTDDVHMHRKALPRFFEWLATRGDPTTQVMVFGNCHSYQFWRAKLGWYLQGGSGWGFSRHAARRFLDIGEKWVLGLNIWEDFYFAEALNTLGLTAKECNCPFFAGLLMSKKKYQRWNWKDPEMVQNCPAVIEDNTCGVEPFPYRDVLFHHTTGFDMGQQGWAEWLAAVPDYAMVYSVLEQLVICRVAT